VRPLHPQADVAGRAVHHAGVEGNGGKNLGAEERATKLEYELFQRVREQVLEQLPPCSLPPRRWGSWTRWPPSPRRRAFTTIAAGNRRGGILQIRQGRHPVLEQSQSGSASCPTTCCWTARAAIDDHHRAEHGGKSTSSARGADLLLPCRLVCPGGGGADRPGGRIFTASARATTCAGQSTFMWK